MMLVFNSMMVNNYNHFPKIKAYAAFVTGGMCRNPGFHSGYFDPSTTKDEYACEIDSSGYYNPQCRNWFLKQMKNSDKSIATSLYTDSATNLLFSTMCTALTHPLTGEFYGALCFDINTVQDFLDYELDLDIDSATD